MPAPLRDVPHPGPTAAHRRARPQVSRGQKLGDHEGAPFAEMTVEDLLEVGAGGGARVLGLLGLQGAARARAAGGSARKDGCGRARKDGGRERTAARTLPPCPALLQSVSRGRCERARPWLLPACRQPHRFSCRLRRPPARAQVVRRLPPEASAVKAVGQGLYYFDSGALAALLKELNKSGHVRRAQEVRPLRRRRRPPPPLVTAAAAGCCALPGLLLRLAAGGWALLHDRHACCLLGRCQPWPPAALPPALRPNRRASSTVPPPPHTPPRSSTGCAAWTTATTCTRCATP